jgi:hypothetical protein
VLGSAPVTCCMWGLAARRAGMRLQALLHALLHEACQAGMAGGGVGESTRAVKSHLPGRLRFILFYWRWQTVGTPTSGRAAASARRASCGTDRPTWARVRAA